MKYFLIKIVAIKQIVIAFIRILCNGISFGHTFFQGVYLKEENDKIEFCSHLNCYRDGISVCGMRIEGTGYRLRLFESECDLLKFGCSVDEELAYGIVNKEYCTEAFSTNTTINNHHKSDLNDILNKNTIDNQCHNLHCKENEIKEICGIRQEGIGFKVRLFDNECDLLKYNCEKDANFTVTDLFICKPEESTKRINDIDNILNNNELSNVTNIVVVNTQMFGKDANLNDSIDAFFATSHIYNLPIKEVISNTRRKWIKNAGPVKVFTPWIVIPKNISNDTYHVPTLSSCYHKCPTKCPDTYAPVCGVPGIVAREPSLMFQNHCFMDVAQCKMFWEQKSSTAHSSSYVETSFLFCMGDEMNAVYRFLPAVRTLQKMGRLKKKGKFRLKLKNFRFIREFRSGLPNFMG